MAIVLISFRRQSTYALGKTNHTRNALPKRHESGKTQRLTSAIARFNESDQCWGIAKMERQRVNSSAAVSVGYDSASWTLEVEYQGGIYQYYNVPQSI